MVARLIDEVGPEHVALGSDCTRNWGDDYVDWLRNGRWQPPGTSTRGHVAGVAALVHADPRTSPG